MCPFISANNGNKRRNLMQYKILNIEVYLPLHICNGRNGQATSALKKLSDVWVFMVKKRQKLIGINDLQKIIHKKKLLGKKLYWFGGMGVEMEVEVWVGGWTTIPQKEAPVTVSPVAHF